jgi:hypothetical protein
VLTAGGGDASAPGVATSPPADQFIILPLRVHVLTADDADVDCKLSDDDVRRIVGKVNRVWRPAGVYFGLESIVREPAAKQERFKKVREELGAVPLGVYKVLRPEGSRQFGGLHVYYVHKLPVNGVYMGEDFAVVQETAKLREVEGGIDEPVPRVTSHELGHALSLPHRQDRTNLMASGTTGTLLNAEEVAAARAKAEKTDGATSPAKCREAADAASKKGDEPLARRLSGWVEEIETATQRK